MSKEQDKSKTPQGSHKEKAPLNRAHEQGNQEAQGYMQGLKSPEGGQGKKVNKQDKPSPQPKDRNEGQQREQKS